MAPSRILVVEDDASIAMGLEDDLRLEGYDVTIARDGVQALRMATEHTFDAVLLDLMLPGKTGYDVCRELRRSGLHMAVIMLTARTQDAEKILGLDLGADDYVTKPFNPMELRARLRAVLRRTSGPDQASYQFGDVFVDFKRHEVRRGTSTVDLSTIEYRLLTTFIEQRSQVLTRAQLLDRVWGHGVHVTDRVVDNHIVGLRRKIEVEPASPRFIVSIRGTGYRFDG